VRTLGYFDDPRVALVQTPQDFYNVESFEHAGTATEKMQYHEQALFYRVIQAGKNRWGAAFWCGTGAVVRASALRDVGGVATETITEDIHTTIRLHRRGWRTVYHNEVLVRGLAASDAETYQLQRLRWGTGAMQVLRRENPLTVPDLSLGQRLSYAATLLGWFDAWRTLGYLALPILVVLTGAVPIAADAAVFFPAFIITFLLQQLAMRVLSRGYHRPILSIVFELIRMTPNLLATLTLLSRGDARFRVTPKGRTGDARRRVHVPTPLLLVAAASVLASVWFLLTVARLTPVTYGVPWAVNASMLWLAFNAFLVATAVARIRALRYAAERRSSVRFDTELDGFVSGLSVQVSDVSLTGAKAVGPDVPDAARHTLVLVFGEQRVRLRAVMRSRRRDGARTVYGFEFVSGQLRVRAALALALFTLRVLPSPTIVPDLAAADAAISVEPVAA
jgi:cellulose synthase (UDP-forming)